MKSTSAADRESTGAFVTSRFHQLVAGKTWRPTSGSLAPAPQHETGTVQMIAMAVSGARTHRPDNHIPCRSDDDQNRL
jgi:hypothetical protein